MSDSDPFQTIMQLAAGYWMPRCLHVVAELGVADRIGEQPVTAATLARSVGADADALGRVLRSLAACGVFEEAGGGFRHTPASRLLRTDHPASQRAYVRMMGLPVHWAAYGELAHAVRTGEAAMKRVVPGSGTFDYFARHPEEGRIFDEAMTGKSHASIGAVLDAYDFSGFARIADIGGGRGHLIRAILDASPGATGVLFDLPSVIDGASRASDRLALQPGDFFADPLPVCDAYVLMSVIHDWGDPESTAILRAIRRAAPPHAKVLLLEMLVPDEPGPHPAKALDIEMLVMTTGGRERRRAEYAQLYSAAGLRLERTIPTATPTVILEGCVA